MTFSQERGGVIKGNLFRAFNQGDPAHKFNQWELSRGVMRRVFGQEVLSRRFIKIIYQGESDKKVYLVVSAKRIH